MLRLLGGLLILLWVGTCFVYLRNKYIPEIRPVYYTDIKPECLINP